MNHLSISPGTILDLMLFLFGFGFIVFIHELGHFMAARWAGIRVLAFAIGFGPAVCSYRRGLGLRQGSSEAEYHRILATSKSGDAAPSMLPRSISSTEYRLNWLPFGGYVRMLGQDDLRPDAVSDARDSYQSVKPWKRMIVISAGVVMNIILSAILFVIVFMAGLTTEPPVIGRVFPGTPAARAQALNARVLGITEAGLKPGDRIVEVDGEVPREFSEVILETTMAERGVPVSMLVKREGTREALRFSIVPEASLASGLLEIGIEPPRSARIVQARTDAERQAITRALDRSGLTGVQPGMTLIGTTAGSALASFAEADRLLRQSQGKPISLRFAHENSRTTDVVDVVVTPQPSMQVGFVRTPKGVTPVDHLLGLVPVMTVGSVDSPEYERGREQGLVTGDIFARLGAIEYPGVSQGMAEIRSHKGKRVPITVLRKDPSGTRRAVSFDAKVTSEGTIGFERGDTRDESVLVSLPIAMMVVPPSRAPEASTRGVDVATGTAAWAEVVPASVGVVRTPGIRIDMVDGSTVSSFAELRERLRDSTRAAFGGNQENATVMLAVTLPGDEGNSNFDPSRTVEWTLSRGAIASLHELGWDSPLPAWLFEPDQFVLKASGPAEAVQLGIARTKAVMLNTYLTFVRLFQQTVKIEHLKGPVGIAHLGTLIAERGLIWMLFFLALISVNLAVVNFLPFPIVDGGQFLLLVYEQLRGRPASVGFQNAITMGGLALIGSIFLLVTFNDVKNLLGL